MIPHDPSPKGPAELANEILSNLQNLALIRTQYYDYESGLKLLQSLAKLEYKSMNNPDSQLRQTMDVERLNPESQLYDNPMKRHSSFSLDHYSKGVYKLRKFEKNAFLNLESIKNAIEKVEFQNLIPKNREEIIAPHMTRLINLHCLLYNSLYEKGLQESNEIYRRDEILLRAFQKNINSLLKTGILWLNKELMRSSDTSYTRYFETLGKMLDLLNSRESIQAILDGTSNEDQDWASFFQRIPIMTMKVLDHMSLVCESITALNVSRPIFLEVFKKTILTNLENKTFCVQGLNLFLKLYNKEAFIIVDKFFWPIREFQEAITSSIENALEMIKQEHSSRVSDNKQKDYTIKYLYFLSKRPQMMEQLFHSFAELALIPQQVILDKFEILDNEKFLDYVSTETLIKIFRNPKVHEKLIHKFIDKYRRNPESLTKLERAPLLPEINRFCIENDASEKLVELITLNSESEFYPLSIQLILRGNDQFFVEAVPLLLVKAPNLARDLFLHIHEKDLAEEQNATIAKIQDIFFKCENFFQKAEVLDLLRQIVEKPSVSHLIMRSIHKIFQLFFTRKEEIFEGLEAIVARLIERNLMENEKIWNGMKKFFKFDLQKSVKLLESLPQNFINDFFKE